MSHHARRDVARAFAAAAAGLLAVAPTTGRAQEASPVTVHGFLTQAYGRNDGSSLHGMDSVATTDYRAAAVQIRYAISDADNFLVQFAHRRLGNSLLNDAQPEVALDWIFYQRQVAGAVVKLGRVPMPRGIYNETRDVGTLHPFYRAPYNFYTEGMETVDGASVKYTQGLPGGFALDAAAYGGGFDFRQLAFRTTDASMYVTESRAERAYGGQLWLNTPVTGVRVGAGAMAFRFGDFPILRNWNGGRDQDGTLWAASFDATRDRLFVRGEMAKFAVDGSSFEYPSWYAQAGVRVLRRVWLNAQTDNADVSSMVRTSATTSMRLEYPFARDNAVGVKLDVTPNFVLKLEAHEAKGYQYDRFVNPTGPAQESRYGLVSAAVSF